MYTKAFPRATAAAQLKQFSSPEAFLGGFVHDVAVQLFLLLALLNTEGRNAAERGEEP